MAMWACLSLSSDSVDIATGTSPPLESLTAGSSMAGSAQSAIVSAVWRAASRKLRKRSTTIVKALSWHEACGGSRYNGEKQPWDLDGPAGSFMVSPILDARFQGKPSAER